MEEETPSKGQAAWQLCRRCMGMFRSNQMEVQKLDLDDKCSHIPLCSKCREQRETELEAPRRQREAELKAKLHRRQNRYGKVCGLCIHCLSIYPLMLLFLPFNLLFSLQEFIEKKVNRSSKLLGNTLTGCVVIVMMVMVKLFVLCIIFLLVNLVAIIVEALLL